MNAISKSVYYSSVLRPALLWDTKTRRQRAGKSLLLSTAEGKVLGSNVISDIIGLS